MTRRNRTILFLFLTALFLIATPLTILYSLGWRFDWESKKITQPGIFSFKVWPKNVQIYLDGEFEKRTDFFFGSALIENLLAKEYEIEIKKDDFHSWKKTLEIKKRQVTEAKNIVLIPVNPEFGILSKDVEDFFFSPDNKQIISKEINEENPENPSWSLKLFDINRNFKSHLIDERNISKEEVELISLKFSLDSRMVLLKLGLKEKLGYYILEIDKTPPVVINLDFLEPATEEVYFNPADSNKLLALKQRELSEIDLINKKISEPALNNLVSLLTFNNNIYYFDTSGFLFSNDFSFTKPEKLNLISFPLKEETEYKIEILGPHIFLKEGETLYILNGEEKSFEKFFEPIKNLGLSPDSKKMVYFNSHEIWILFLEKEHEQPQKEAGEKLFLTRYSENIGQVFWYTNHYLIFDVGDKIKIAELDDRDRMNIVNLAEFKESEIFWNQNNKQLYVLREGNFFTSRKIAP